MKFSIRVALLEGNFHSFVCCNNRNVLLFAKSISKFVARSFSLNLFNIQCAKYFILETIQMERNARANDPKLCCHL